MTDKTENKAENKAEKKTGNANKGFAANPQNINRGGRPKGSRNKSTLLRAQIQMDSDTEFAAELYGALMRNDKDFLGIKDDVPISMRLAAAKEVMNKTIANEKEKEPQTPQEIHKEEQTTPVFSAIPV